MKKEKDIKKQNLKSNKKGTTANSATDYNSHDNSTNQKTKKASSSSSAKCVEKAISAGNESVKKAWYKRIPKNVWILIGVIVGALIVIGVLAIIFMPQIKELFSDENLEKLKEWVRGAGAVGWLAMFALQCLQVFVAFIPGEPIELIAGALYGVWGGYLLCTLGCVLSSIVVLLISHKLGYKLLYKLFGKEQVDGYAFLKDSSKIEAVTFIVFLIPGTPKDMLTYFMGVTKIPIWKFVLITTIARFPSVISSTMLGSSVIQGEWLSSVWIFIATAAIGITGILLKDKIIEKMKSARNKKNEK